MPYKLKRVRVEKGIKQSDMAKELGITSQYLCKIEKGKAIPRLDIAKKLSSLLEVPIEELFI
jgi:putative transcriptional regulator